jgi:lipopolysaccharide cholinephosphotransferase
MVNLRLQFPENYFNEEVRDGYKVSADMKKVWAVELDLLNEFVQVCKKHNIQFFAAGGTLLGAVRHRGMIPWDDDIDVMMLRSEYERLCKIAPKEFLHPYFFQTEDTDPGSLRGHAQLRNSETTGILNNDMDKGSKINQGIFIDIFPLDAVPENDSERKELFLKIKRITNKFYEYNSYIHPYKFVIRKNLIALCISTIKHFIISKEKAKQQVLKLYRLKQEAICGTNMSSRKLLMSPFYVERWVYDLEDFSSVLYLPFEMIEIPVPVGYEHILTHTYGNWKKYVVGGSEHGGVFFDTDKPFTEYIK